MPSMTLNLTLTGVNTLLASINRLNQALATMNGGLTAAAKKVDLAADKLANSVSQLKTAHHVGRPGGGIAGNAAGRQNAPNNLQDLNSIMFSGYAGATQIMFAKAMTRITDKLIPSIAGASYKGGFNISNRMPTDMNAFTEHMSGVVGKLGMFAGAIAIGIFALQQLGQAFKMAFDNMKEQVKLFSQLGGGAMAASFRGIKYGLNLSNADMPKDPVQAAILLSKLKALRSIKGDVGASQYASSAGIQNYMGIRYKSQKEFEEMIEGKSGIQKSDAIAVYELDFALGELRKVIDGLVISLSPLIQTMADLSFLFKAIPSIIDTIISQIPVIGQLYNLNNAKRKWDDANDKFIGGANKFSESVDKFSEKVGTMGGGNRAQSAVPKAWTWWGYQDNLINDVDRLGAFEF